MNPVPIYVFIARELDRYQRLCKDPTKYAIQPHEVKLDLEDFIKANLPRGSGIDAGTQLDFDKSTPDKLLFTFGFHFMNDAGYYDGWEYYKLYVRPSLGWEFDMKLHGPNRRQIKDYLHETYSFALKQPCPTLPT